MVAFCIVMLLLFKRFFLLILRERLRASKGGAERKGDRIPSRLRTVNADLDAGLELTNREIMT